MGVCKEIDGVNRARSTMGRLLYTCDAPSCDVRRVPWGPNWSWYGSYKDLDDDPFSIPTFCSERCKAEADGIMNPAKIAVRNL